jgi:hypothetical protein
VLCFVQSVVVTASVKWGNYSDPPLDTPTCGFSGELCKPQPDDREKREWRQKNDLAAKQELVLILKQLWLFQ